MMASFYCYDQNPLGYCFLVQVGFCLLKPRLACKPPFGDPREVTRELHAIGDASARDFACHDWRAWSQAKPCWDYQIRR